MHVTRRSALQALAALASVGCGGSRAQPQSQPLPAQRVNQQTPASPAHVLVVGGTGMLRAVAMELARRGHATTVIARSPEPLAEMAEQSGGGVHPLALDYRDRDALEGGLRTAIDERGPLTLVVAWIHGSAPDAPLAVARIAANGSTALRYVHVLGSAADDPSVPEPQRRAAFEAIDRLVYEEVILGFVQDADGSRWLTDDEIAAGVLTAIDAPAPRHVVGVTRPWSARP